MNQYVLAIIVVILAAGLSALITRVAVKQETAGRNDEAVLEKVGTGITYAQSVADAISPFLPKIADTIISKVLSIAQKAVQHVEATYKAALSTDANAADTRKTEATSLIKSALVLDGIADTPEVDKLIDVVIPLLVLALPKTHTSTASTVSAAQTGAGKSC